MRSIGTFLVDGQLWRAPGDAPVRVMAEESGTLSNTVRRELDDEAERLTAFRD